MQGLWDELKATSDYSRTQPREGKQEYSHSLESENIVSDTIRILCVYFREIYMSNSDFERDSSVISGWLLNHAPPSYKETMIWMTAILSCGMGTSSFQWCKEVFTPALAEFEDRTLLVLISTSFIKKHGPLELCQFYALTAPRELYQPYFQNVILMARNPTSGWSACIGLCPGIEGEERHNNCIIDLYNMKSKYCIIT